MIKYRMNLVKSIRVAEKQSKKHTANMVLMALVCFGILGAGGFDVYQKLSGIQKEIRKEKLRVKKIEAEYNEYQATQFTIDKADVELLNELMSRRIYWTKVVKAMAEHLPDQQPTAYWITRFGHKEHTKTFSVYGYGYITDRQEQLLSLDEYLNKLRADSSYSDAFGSTYLKSAVRSDEEDRNYGMYNERVSFEYASLRKGGVRR